MYSGDTLRYQSLRRHFAAFVAVVVVVAVGKVMLVLRSRSQSVYYYLSYSYLLYWTALRSSRLSLDAAD